MTNSEPLIEKAEAGATLTRAEAESIMEELLSGHVDTPAIVRLLIAMNLRPVSVAELAGFASTMRRHAAPVFAPGETPPENLVDTCGTGGDASGTFNISTAAAFVAAAAGAHVAKHGNRSSSSRSGSADVLEALGIRIDVPMRHAGQAIREVGIGFLFALVAHAATRHAMPARKQIGKRTVFNLLGPLTNPAGADRQVLGVFAYEAVDLVAATLLELGAKRAFVVHGSGLDEISLAGETHITEVRDGRIHSFSVTPEVFGVARAPHESLRGGTPHENAEIILEIFRGRPGPPRDVVLVNAAAALVVSGIAEDFRSGAQLASQVIDSGAALAKVQQLKTFASTANDTSA
jgi:anthranilate phosphoribosyltransferase